jgi:hypothetical protein
VTSWLGRHRARLLALLLGLLLAELILRLGGARYPVWDRPTAGLREWGVPHAEGFFVGETRRWVRLNSLGVHDVEHTLAKPEDVVRIVVVGDSYVAAFEVAIEEAFWSVAERELETCKALGGRRVEFINLSKRGYGTTEELLALRRFGFDYDPDWVVLAFLTGNDLRNNSRALKRSNRPYYVHAEDGRLVLDESYAESDDYRRSLGWRGALWRASVNRSRLLQVGLQLRRRWKGWREEVATRRLEEGGEPGLDDGVYLEPNDPAWRSAWRVSEDVIRLMRDEVEARGARFLLATLSNAIQVDPDRARRERYAARIGARDLFHPDRRLEAFARSEGIAAIALAPELRAWAEESGRCVHGFEGPWRCRGHWNADGHRVAGEKLAAALCEAMDTSG